MQADHTTLGDQTVLSIVHTGIKDGAATVVLSKSAEDYVVSWILARLTEWGLYQDQAESAEGQPDEGDRKESEGVS